MICSRTHRGLCNFQFVITTMGTQYSFGCIAVYHMKEEGWVKISQDDTMKLHYQYQDEKAQAKPAKP